MKSCHLSAAKSSHPKPVKADTALSFVCFGTADALLFEAFLDSHVWIAGIGTRVYRHRRGCVGGSFARKIPSSAASSNQCELQRGGARRVPCEAWLEVRRETFGSWALVTSIFQLRARASSGLDCQAKIWDSRVFGPATFREPSWLFL